MPDYCEDFYGVIAKHVLMQKIRVGGRFAVAREVPTRKARECIRKILPDCIFAILTMDTEIVKKRLKGRGHKDSEIESFMKENTPVELPDEEEMNTCVVHITEEMGVKDVMDKVEIYVSLLKVS